MNGNEVNQLMSPEARSSLDENKSKDALIVKLNIFDAAFHNLEAAQTTTNNVVGESFAFIPFPCGAFVDMLTEAFFLLGHDRNKKFLDIGCGFGSKVILACSLFDGYGIEYNQDYVDKANLLGLNRVGLGDAFTFNKYDQFDLLYYYRPIHDDARYRIFENLVHRNMKVGALVAPMHTHYEWDNLADIKRETKFLYRKIK